MTPWPRPDKVYFISTCDLAMVKIGSSSQPLVRLKKYLLWSPVPLQLLSSAPGSYREEFALHRYFADHHSHCEWYRGVPELLRAAKIASDTGAIAPEFLVMTHGRIPNRRGKIVATGVPRHDLRPDLYPRETAQ